MHFRFQKIFKLNYFLPDFRHNFENARLRCAACTCHPHFLLTYFRMNLIQSLEIPHSYSPESHPALARCIFEFGMQIHAFPFAVCTLYFTEETIFSRIFIKTISTFGKFKLNIHRTSICCWWCLPGHNCNLFVAIAKQRNISHLKIPSWLISHAPPRRSFSGIYFSCLLPNISNKMNWNMLMLLIYFTNFSIFFWDF